MLLRGGAFSAYNAGISENQSTFKISNSIFWKKGNGFVLCNSSDHAQKAQFLRVLAVATGEAKTKQQETSNEPTLADQLRFGRLTKDGLSYKERFIMTQL
ncbi:unnamed protein product [Fraxinus pennsylvanica]|uniref:Uncharacterized protein n=1 Tax=Fraxinus pennsylvanica TaxID=56036 RepID=A0AAD1YSE3_9LAMI|nr:unnamed protein product [Fraxinus pennsylvanica]